MVRIGTRILKTGIAVTITMYICKKLNLEPAVFGAVSAVVNMQPSLYLTFRTAGEQVVIHILGVLIGLAFGWLLGGSPLTIGIATVTVILIYTRLRLKHGILMGVVASIFILSSSSDQFLAHALGRTGVIFAGLLTAMAVNVFLWPPRYGRAFYDRLRESNEQAVDYFCQAVRDFINLDDKVTPAPGEARERALSSAAGSRELAAHYRNERKNFGEDFDFIDPNGWFALAERVMRYNESMIDKADQIYEFLTARLERRLNSGAGPVSSEFQVILDKLGGGCVTIRRVNRKLTTVICDKTRVSREEISETYWEELTGAIERWQPRLIGSYYLHALIEVSVVAGEIRWVAREGKKLLLEAGKEEGFVMGTG